MASFFIRSKKTGKWYLFEQSYEEGDSIQKTVSKNAYPNLGFKETWSAKEAREHCKVLNKQEKWKRRELNKIASIAQRVIDIETSKSIFVPQVLTEEFHKTLMAKSFGSEAHQKKIHSHFKKVLEIVNHLQIEAKDYADNKERFYSYFLEKKYSPDYVNKLLRIINMFGIFICKKKLLPYEGIPSPSSHVKNKIDEAYQESEDYIGESDPLTPEMLTAAEAKLNPAHYKWLFISVWLGLRPIEIDSLKKPGTWKQTVASDDTMVLWVYQSKLTGLKKDKRWKKIPLIYPEQLSAFQFIMNNEEFRRPLREKLAEVFSKDFITTYAGRKGFVNLMLGKGQSLEAISSWMGHQDISITWKKYRDKEEVMLGKKIS